MRLCMFHPVGHPLERGWVGRIDGERVLQLAAQTLQSFFTGGGTAREHAEYPLNDVVLLAPVLHPPSVRLFDDQATFAFANPAAVARARCGRGRSGLEPDRVTPTCRRDRRGGSDRGVHRARRVARARRGAAEGSRLRSRARPRRRDAGRARRARRPVTRSPSSTGPPPSRRAAARTVLYPGDIVAGPASDPLEDLEAGAAVSIEVDGIGVLEQRVAG